MDYEQVRAVFFVPSPPGTTEPDIMRNATPARRLRDAIEPIAMHAVWCAPTNQRLAGYGLDFLSAYIWGRAAALGDPTPGVVIAAFAVFEPTLITTHYESGRTKLPRQDLLAARDGATTESLRALLPEADPTPVTIALRRALEAADPTGRPLFAGLSARPWPSDPHAQLWRACDLLREHRGDSHVAACVSAGLDGVEMNILTELWLGIPLYSYSATRGWPAPTLEAAATRLRSRGLLATDSLTPTGQAFRTALETHTDNAQQRLIDAIGPDLLPATTQLATWSEALIEAQAFPPNIHKRAAG